MSTGISKETLTQKLVLNHEKRKSHVINTWTDCALWSIRGSSSGFLDLTAVLQVSCTSTAPSCGHNIHFNSSQYVECHCVCWCTFRGWRFPWSLCCSGQLPRCLSPTVSTPTTGKDQAGSFSGKVVSRLNAISGMGTKREWDLFCDCFQTVCF